MIHLVLKVIVERNGKQLISLFMGVDHVFEQLMSHGNEIRHLKQESEVDICHVT